MIPALNDAELEAILGRAKEAGASSARYILLRLPHELKDIFREWLEAYYPTKAKHVLNLVRDTRGGALYRSRYGERMRGTGPYAELLEQRFRAAVRKLGLHRPLPVLSASEFRRPAEPARQMSLFDD
jgi:DNA repair photolyase